MDKVVSEACLVQARASVSFENFLLATFVVLWTVLGSGCAKLKPGVEPVQYQTVASNGRHDTATAERRHKRAIKFIQPGTLEKAEQLLNEALVADSTYGPAHNSLGTVYFNQDQLYLAAWEFEYAIKLMPELAEPYNNLGLVYERAGKYDDALGYYSMAIEREPDSSEITGNIVRTRLLAGDRSLDLQDTLSDLALNHQNRTWRSWARDQAELTKFDGSTSCVLEGCAAEDGALDSQILPYEELPEPTPQPILDVDEADGSSSRVNRSQVLDLNDLPDPDAIPESSEILNLEVLNSRDYSKTPALPLNLSSPLGPLPASAIEE